MLIYSRAGAPGYSRHGRRALAPCLHTSSLKLPLAGVPAKQRQAARAASGRRPRLPHSTLRVRAYLNQQQQPQYPAQYGSYSHTLASSTAAAAKLTKGAYLFEVQPDDPSKSQTFQTEQAMLARYNHLLKESGLMDNLKARAHFERPRDKAQRRRQQRIEQHKWQRKQAGYAPESLESAGGPDMVLEEPYEEFFELRAAWDTATDPGEAPWAQQLAEQQQQQQQATYGYYAYEPNNVVDLGAYMPPGSDFNAAVGGSGEFGGYMAGGSSSSSSSSSSGAGGYSSSSSAAAPAGAGGLGAAGCSSSSSSSQPCGLAAAAAV
ncbi:hypothetical protein OEZ86_012074 [Tetradesmus obliquus]|nr:hypothetical protein OEZ86_012074 [Tetradesmus obliquus]